MNLTPGMCRICSNAATFGAFCALHWADWQESPEWRRQATMIDPGQKAAAVTDFASRIYREIANDKAIKATHCNHELPLGECKRCSPDVAPPPANTVIVRVDPVPFISAEERFDRGLYNRVMALPLKQSNGALEAEHVAKTKRPLDAGLCRHDNLEKGCPKCAAEAL